MKFKKTEIKRNDNNTRINEFLNGYRERQEQACLEAETQQIQEEIAPETLQQDAENTTIQSLE